MLAKITKSHQFRDGCDYEKFVSGSFEAIMKHAHQICGPDTEEEHTIDFDHRPDENKISLVHWVTAEVDPDFADEEPDHYWQFVVDVKFVADVVEECKDEVVAI